MTTSFPQVIVFIGSVAVKLLLILDYFFIKLTETCFNILLSLSQNSELEI